MFLKKISSITTSSHKMFLFQWKCFFFLQKLFHQIMALHPKEEEDLSLLLCPSKKTVALFLLYLCSRKEFAPSPCSEERVHEYICFVWNSYEQKWDLSKTRARNMLLVNKCLFQCFVMKKALFWKTAKQNSWNNWNQWELCTQLSFPYS